MKHTKTLYFFFVCLFFALSATAQTVFERQINVPIIANNDTLSLAWAGGLNNPQFSEADLNNDQIADLFIFDRSGDNIIALINSGISNTIDYSLSLSATQHFPHLENWALLRDYNCDGAPDIFTAVDGDGIQMYTGSWNNNNQLTFSTTLDKILINDTTLFVALYDIPAIDDMDNDNDLDILTFAQGGGHIVLYKNMAAETNNACAIPQYINADPCWGDFYESGLTTSLDLNYPCSGILSPDDPQRHTNIMPTSSPIAQQAPNNKNTRHPGSTLFTTDLDGNGTTDVVLGDISFDNFVAAYNDNNNADAHTSIQDTLFPSYNTSTHLYIFPAAFEADIDNNGTKDMLVSPNAKAQSQNYSCVWLYRNSQTIGTNYMYETDTFLTQDMIDLNRRAAPALFDHNNDGLLDIVIGNYGYMNNDQQFNAKLALYENIGTATQPAFNLVSKNYANVNGQFALPRLSLKPTFGDLDSDGDADMLIGDNDGYLHYFQNQPTNGIAHFVLSSEQYQGLDIGQNVSPQLFDLDGDGLLDLLAGNHNGIIQYRRNIGTSTTPLFTNNTNAFLGGVDMRKPGSPTGHATPFMTTYNGSKILICGSESGLVRVFNNIENNINTGGVFTELTQANKGITQADSSTQIREGEFAKPAVADINNNGRLDILIGINQGGLIWVEAPDTVAVGIHSPNLAQQNPISIYPNPSRTNLSITLPNNLQQQNPSNLQLYDINGNLYQQIDFSTTNYPTTINLSIANIPTGIYIVRFVNAQNSWIEKIIKY